MARKPARQVQIPQELQALLDSRPSGGRRKRALAEIKATLTENMLAGDQVLKHQIPKRYRKKFGVNNLYRYRLPAGFRCVYTLLSFPGVGVCPVILDLLDHDEYDAVFGYQTS